MDPAKFISIEMLDRVFSEEYPDLARAAMWHGSSECQADDFVQDAYIQLRIRVLEGKATFATDVATKAYIKATIGSAVANERRKLKRLVFKDSLPDQPDARNGPPSELGIDVEGLCKQGTIPESIAIALQLRLYGLTPQEIATRLGISSKAVATRLFRARGLLSALVDGRWRRMNKKQVKALRTPDLKKWAHDVCPSTNCPAHAITAALSNSVPSGLSSSIATEPLCTRSESTSGGSHSCGPQAVVR